MLDLCFVDVDFLEVRGRPESKFITPTWASFQLLIHVTGEVGLYRCGGVIQVWWGRTGEVGSYRCSGVVQVWWGRTGWVGSS